ncbi:MAG: NfeD family protein [Acidimicrobiia bacterium]
MRRSLFLIILVAFGLAGCSPRDGGGIDVIDVSGPLDSSALEFMIESIDAAAEDGQVLAVLQINSRAVLDEPLLDELESLVANPPLPLAVWLGPAPAQAFGGVAIMVEGAPVVAAAPGTIIGRRDPVIAGGEGTSADESLAEETGIELQPTIRQYLQSLDGQSLPTADGDVVVSTLVEFEGTDADGLTLRTVTFRNPGLITRFFRLAATPEVAFFFLVVGLTLVTFEFYALGPGVAAGVAALSLWLASWGIVNLPVRPAALAATILGWILLTAAYQRGGVIFLTFLGAIVLQVGGMSYVNGSGQIEPRWWLILLSVLAALFFFLLAMPTVQRSRLSTQTIGRESLVGKTGAAVSDFDPEGLVEVDGSRWRATAHREAGLAAGDPIVVAGVDGLFLEVEPVQS